MQQNTFDNRWTSSQYVTNIFVFFPDGTIVLPGINYPGIRYYEVNCSEISTYKKIHFELKNTPQGNASVPRVTARYLFTYHQS